MDHPVSPLVRIDGHFSDDENHTKYRCGNALYDITSTIDYSEVGNTFSVPSTKQDKRDILKQS